MRAKDLRGFGPVGTNGPAPLSTPAASTGDAERFNVHVYGDASFEYVESPNGEWVHYADYRKLLDRNAAQAARIAELWGYGSEKADLLTALLDGIEGLEKRYLDRVIDHVARSEKTSRIADSEWEAGAGSALGIVAKELKALRESSVPAIGEKA